MGTRGHFQAEPLAPVTGRHRLKACPDRWGRRSRILVPHFRPYFESSFSTGPVSSPKRLSKGWAIFAKACWKSKPVVRPPGRL